MEIKHGEDLNILEEIASNINEQCKNILYCNTDDQHLIAMMLYSTIVNYYNSCICLLKNEFFCSISPIARSMLEAIADMFIVINYKDGIKFILASYLSQQIKINKLRYEHENKNDFNFLVEKYKEIQCEQKKENYCKLNTVEKFKKSKLPDSFYIRYSLICSDLHNNLASIESHYLESYSESSYRVSMDKGFDNKKKCILIEILVVVLITATEKVIQFLDVQNICSYKNAESSMKQLLDKLKNVLSDSHI